MSTPETGAPKPPAGPRLTFGQLIAGLVAVVIVVVLVRSAVGDGQPEPQPTTTAAPITSPSPGGTGLPACRLANEQAVLQGYEDWQRTLIDPIYELSRDYTPPNLTSVSQAGFVGDFEVRHELIADLTKLRKAAQRNGTPLGIVAAYRSFDEQQELFDIGVDQMGKEAALAHTARPGHSEHQLGTAIDFRDADEQDVTPSWGNEPAGEWMAENAGEYGFVLSYPRGESDVVCYGYEPWHFRYVGRDDASQVRVQDITLREYLWNEQ